ncbi:MAG: secretion protein HlyD [Microcoleus sp.]
MFENQQHSLFTELTDAESATVSGGNRSSGVSDLDSNSDASNSNADDINSFFFVPDVSQLYMYDPSRQRPYKTIVV